MSYHIYCDESRQSQDRFMVLGGIIVPEDNISVMEKTMAKFRVEEGVHQELKWGKVSNSWMPKYKRFIDFFFALCDTDKIHFKCMIVDNHQTNHRKYNGNYETGFYKMYYQLLLHQFGTKYI
jgi:uncharacterized protein DUF3800